MCCTKQMLFNFISAGLLGILTETTLQHQLRGALDKTVASPAVVAAATEHETAGSGVSADDIARESLLCCRFMKFPDSKLSIEPSEIAGVGVFAAADIALGEVITCYPGDAVTYRLPQSPSSKQQDAEGIRGVIWGLHVPQRLRRLAKRDDDYALKVDETYGIIGLRALGTDDLAYAGHLINDGASLGDFGWSAEEYMRASVEKANAGHKALLGCHTATIATRDIAEGEELLVTCMRAVARTRYLDSHAELPAAAACFRFSRAGADGPKYWLSKKRRQVEQVSQVFSSFL